MKRMMESTPQLNTLAVRVPAPGDAGKMNTISEESIENSAGATKPINTLKAAEQVEEYQNEWQ